MVYKRTPGSKSKSKGATKWHASYMHNGVQRKVALYHSKDESQAVERKLRRLAATKPGAPLADDLRSWLDNECPASLRATLTEHGLVSGAAARAGGALSEMVDEFVSGLEAKGRSVAHVASTRSEILAVIAACPTFTTPASLTVQPVRKYMEQRTEAGRSAATINASVGAIKSFGAWLAREEILSLSPFRNLERPTLPKKSTTGVLTHDEFAILIASVEASTRTGWRALHMDGPTRAMLYRIAASTGIRRGELAKLKVHSVASDGSSFVIEVDTSKAGSEDVTVTVQPHIASALRDHVATMHPQAHVFPTLVSSTSKNAYNPPCAAALKSDLADSGFEHEDGAGRFVDETGRRITFHSLRHSFCTWMGAIAAIPESVRQEAMRHATPAMTRLYTRTAPAQTSDALLHPDMKVG